MKKKNFVSVLNNPSKDVWGVEMKLQAFVTSALERCKQSGSHSDHIIPKKMANDITWMAEVPTLCERVAYFAGDEEVLPLHDAFIYLALDAVSHFRFISIYVGAVQMSVASVDGILDRSLYLPRFGLEM
jgi:hypothetical protein